MFYAFPAVSFADRFIPAISFNKSLPSGSAAWVHWCVSTTNLSTASNVILTLYPFPLRLRAHSQYVLPLVSVKAYKAFPAANSRGKKPRQIPAANSRGKEPRHILAANSHGKWLTLTVFVVIIIQLLSRKGASYAFNVPNRYLITQTKKYEHDKKYFLNKVFKKLWNSFRILSSLSMKYCSMKKKKTLAMYRVCITKRPREIYDRFLNKEKWHSQVIWMFSTFRKYCLLPEKEIWRIVALCIFLKKKLSYPYRCKDVLPLFGRNSSSFDIYTQFYLSASPSRTRVTEFTFFTTTIFTEIWRCSSWKRCTFI